ncbi:cation-transporting P-type ATPase [Mucilaginibacter sp. RB4R14]|uniref:cation-transporting P-type ATPase n=1 Tax=Mucilaginibacter aurantiaciroseus TaxID=2949308 RepID=UPI0020919C23|nr:cation-transporting P-type ATPase [Mucilaginibacter aurantiaciroseus]MCO5935485.1 cation-transporting P-type ATPase [Mucilaginibacter aurantiaciroseus]
MAFKQEEAFQQLHTGQNGLDEHEVVRLRQQYGFNTIKANGSSPAFLLFLSQFKSPITLIAAALLSAGLGDVADTLIILAIVLISSFLGFWQEKGASDAVTGFTRNMNHITVNTDSQTSYTGLYIVLGIVLISLGSKTVKSSFVKVVG